MKNQTWQTRSYWGWSALGRFTFSYCHFHSGIKRIWKETKSSCNNKKKDTLVLVYIDFSTWAAATSLHPVFCNNYKLINITGTFSLSLKTDRSWLSWDDFSQFLPKWCLFWLSALACHLDWTKLQKINYKIMFWFLYVLYIHWRKIDFEVSPRKNTT